MMKQIEEFLMLHKPHVIVVSTSALNGSRTMQRFLEDCAGEAKRQLHLQGYAHEQTRRRCVISTL
jgi:hypothetical protein